MCLLALQYQTLPAAPILVLANREESYARPGTPPHRVPGNPGQPDWVGGLDPRAGGTWLGVNAHGVLVAITNRRKTNLPENPRSRGLLCRDLLAAPSARAACDQAVTALAPDNSSDSRKPQYAGCNFVLVDRDSAWAVEAGDHFRVRHLAPGLHIITNGDLEDPNDARIARVRREIQNTHPQTLAEWRLRGEKICSARAEGSEPAICLEGEQGGTVSSSLIAFGGSLDDIMYWHAAGPPVRTPFLEYSPLLRSILDSTTLSASVAEPYRITLRGPWEYALLDSQHRVVSTGKLRLPLSEPDPLNGHRGFVRWNRKFHRPTNLSPQDRVKLVFTSVGGSGTVTLNEVPLGELTARPGIQSFDITNRMRGNDELIVELSPSHTPDSLQPSGAFVSVAIDIHSGTAQ